jgi:SAM-dependent methyltransferase
MDVFGKALSDFYTTGEADILVLHNSYGETEEMPVDLFFREEADMPFMELKAIELCKGKILDVGAGAGSHSLLLQDIGKDVTALDISEDAVSLMLKRGVENAITGDIFSMTFTGYDTLLFLMNGIGLTGTLPGLKQFLAGAHSLINEGGQILFDSSDISYLYEGIEQPAGKFFGEVSYCYEYQGTKGEWFNWVYLDQKTLKDIALQTGWQVEIIDEDDEDQYLAKLTILPGAII